MDRNVFGITCAYQFWSEVVAPTYFQYCEFPAAKEAFNICTSIHHLLDWIQSDVTINKTNLQINDIREYFYALCPNLRIIADISNYSKHCVLTSKRKSTATSSTAHIQGMKFYFTRLGPFSDHPARYEIELIDGSKVELFLILNEVIDFWDNFFKSNQTI